MVSPNENELLDLIYGAALAPNLWTSTIERLADLVGGSSGFLSRLNVVDGSGSVVTARIDPSAMERYFAHFSARNPLHIVQDADTYMRDWSPRILTDDDWMPKADLVRTEFYNDYMRRSDVHSVMMIRLAAAGDDVCVVNISRPERRGRFDAEALANARRLHPHLIRAFNLARRLNEGQSLGAGVGAVFDGSPHGLFVLDGEARILRMNAAGESLVAAGKGLVVIGGRLTANEAATAATLDALVRQAAAGADRRRGGSMPIRPQDSAAILSLTVAPAPLAASILLEATPSVIVCVTDPASGAAPPDKQLRQLYGLTRMEVKVAALLFEGATPREVGDRLGISFNTVRVHIARIFEKTGVGRQSELVALMVRSVGVRLGEDEI